MNICQKRFKLRNTNGLLRDLLTAINYCIFAAWLPKHKIPQSQRKQNVTFHWSLNTEIRSSRIHSLKVFNIRRKTPLFHNRREVYWGSHFSDPNKCINWPQNRTGEKHELRYFIIPFHIRFSQAVLKEVKQFQSCFST